MIKKLIKGMLVMSLFALLLAPAISNAQSDDPYGINDPAMGNLELDGNVEPRSAAVGIINLVLSFLGLVAVVIVLIGGFKWMTAGGNEEKVGAAKKLLIGGLIGLVIVLLAWGISTWVLTTIPDLAQ